MAFRGINQQWEKLGQGIGVLKEDRSMGTEITIGNGYSGVKDFRGNFQGKSGCLWQQGIMSVSPTIRDRGVQSRLVKHCSVFVRP